MSDDVTPAQVLAKAKELLAHHRGLFIGEQHYSGPLKADGSHDDFSLARDFVMNHMQALKKAGVSTVYVEYNMYKTQAMQAGPECRAAYMGPSTEPEEITNLQLIIASAKAAGLRVIGYDDVKGDNAQWDMLYKLARDKAHPDPKPMIDTVSGGEAMDRRDRFGAELIERTYDGKKFIVYGGFGHSFDDFPDRASQKSLTTRLGIPALNFVAQNFFLQGNAVMQQEYQAEDQKASAAGQPLPVHMRASDKGEGTFKVTSNNSTAFAPDGAALSTPAKQKLLAAGKQMQASGICEVPDFMKNKSHFDLADLDRVVHDLPSQGHGKARPKSP